MIDSLNGELLERGIDHAVIDCHGVGYLVHLPATVMVHLPTRGNCRLFIHYSVSVDVRSGQSEHRLFGFRQADERQLFRKLIEVQGVSATLALAIMSARSADDVRSSIILGDEGALKGIKGIGPKLAQRIIGELQGKLGLGGAALPSGLPAGSGNTLRAEALSALVSLGMDRAKAERALQGVLSERGSEPPQLEELIKLTLKNL
ncbi:MAG: Holliday junction branch migration protein RuvA [Flavobacteriales bacterium]|jgi:Holliday junction DNA helicase RuvA|nr:Holliday junction branch migration protein RuvA [Flavobacteriales bacterium]